jgi:DNA-binding NarL/FixJ family response regulator
MDLFLVENSIYVRERLVSLVSHHKDTQVVGFASTAQQALKEIHRLGPDVVLLDIRLDEGSGMDVLRDLKQSSHSPVVIVLTNYAYPQYRAKFIEAGAEYFFDKSAELDAMLGALDTVQSRLAKNYHAPSWRKHA